MQYLITNHAVEQFIKRWHPEKTFNKAKIELNGLLRTSGYAGKTRLGDQILASGYRPEIRMVVKDRNVCVTVLPSTQDAEQIYLDELEELEFARQQELEHAVEDIKLFKQEITRIDAQRAELAKSKSHLLSNIQILENKITRMKYCVDNLVEMEE